MKVCKKDKRSDRTLEDVSIKKKMKVLKNKKIFQMCVVWEEIDLLKI